MQNVFGANAFGGSRLIHFQVCSAILQDFACSLTHIHITNHQIPFYIHCFHKAPSLLSGHQASTSHHNLPKAPARQQLAPSSLQQWLTVAQGKLSLCWDLCLQSIALRCYV